MNIYELTLEDMIAQDFDKALEYMEYIIYEKHSNVIKQKELFEKGKERINEYSKNLIKEGSYVDVIPDKVIKESYKEFDDFVEENGSFDDLDFLPYKGINFIFTYMGEHIWSGNKKYDNIFRKILNNEPILLESKDLDYELIERPEDYGKGVSIIIRSFKYKITNKKRSYRFSIGVLLDDNFVEDSIITYVFKNDNLNFEFYNIDDFKFKVESKLLKKLIKDSINLSDFDIGDIAKNRLEKIDSLLSDIIENRFVKPLAEKYIKENTGKELEKIDSLLSDIIENRFDKLLEEYVKENKDKENE